MAGKRRISSSVVEPEAADLVCQLDNVQGMVDALTSVRWKRHQVPLSALTLSTPFSLSKQFIFRLLFLENEAREHSPRVSLNSL